VLDRFSALLARQAKAEKKRVEHELTTNEEKATDLNSRIAPTSWQRKAHLYARVAATQGLTKPTPGNGGLEP